MDKFIDFHALISDLIQLNKTNRNLARLDMMHPFEYAKEFCTVKIDIGRQTGKTEYIRLNADEDDLIIAYSHRYKKDLMSNFKTKDSNKIYNIKAWEDLKYLERRYRNFYIDESTIFKIDVYDNWPEMYRRLVDQDNVFNQTFIFLG